MTLTPYLIAWVCLAVVVIALAILRNLTALHEDDNLHLAAAEQQLIPRQMTFFRMMDRLDRWGKTLTVVTVATGLVLGAFYFYQSIAGRF